MPFLVVLVVCAILFGLMAVLPEEETPILILLIGLTIIIGLLAQFVIERIRQREMHDSMAGVRRKTTAVWYFNKRFQLLTASIALPLCISIIYFSFFVDKFGMAKLDGESLPAHAKQIERKGEQAISSGASTANSTANITQATMTKASVATSPTPESPIELKPAIEKQELVASEKSTIVRTNKEVEKTDERLESIQKEVKAAVDEWRKAWSSADLKKYFSSYSATFLPANQLSRKDWEAARRTRINAAPSITLELAELKLHVIESGKVEASFIQKYTAGAMRDTTRKTLVLELEGRTWRIVAENAELTTAEVKAHKP